MLPFKNPKASLKLWLETALLRWCVGRFYTVDCFSWLCARNCLSPQTQLNIHPGIYVCREPKSSKPQHLCSQGSLGLQADALASISNGSWNPEKWNGLFCNPFCWKEKGRKWFIPVDEMKEKRGTAFTTSSWRRATYAESAILGLPGRYALPFPGGMLHFQLLFHW